MKKLLLLIAVFSFIVAQSNSLQFGNNDYVELNSYSLNGDFSISVDAALISGSNGVMYRQINGGEIHLAFEQDQIRFGVKASSCGSSGGWHQIYLDLDELNIGNEFHKYTGVYSRYGQYLKLFIDNQLIETISINSTNIASCNYYSAGMGFTVDGKMQIKSFDIWEGITLTDETISNGIPPTNSWEFSGQSETIIYDTIGSNNGIINGATWVENISGCTDPNATNHNPNATIDDGSCEYDSFLHVPIQFETIQEAVNNAVNGDTILIADGVYSGEGNKDISLLGKTITLMSSGGFNNCIIDCEYSGRGFIINQGETNSSLIQGLTVKNCTPTTEPLEYGGAIYIEDNSSISINSCLFESITVRAIQVGDTQTGGSPTYISNSIFRNCNNAISSSKKTVYTENCVFENNYGTEICGNGHYANPEGYYKNCIFRNNDAEYRIIGLGHGWTIENCLFYNNNALGGTIYMNTNWNGLPLVTKSTFWGNGGEHQSSSWYDHRGNITNSIFWNNNAIDQISGNTNLINFNYSLLQGGTGGAPNGTGNIIDIDPLFIDPENGDFHLQIDSPALNAGENGVNLGCNVELLPWELIQPILGCTNQSACNFNPAASDDDGSCTYPEENFDCGGNCIVEIDCNDECAGLAQLDDCGICDENTENDNQDMDCAGVCFGTSLMDDFEECCDMDLIDDCNKCGGNGWDMCDNDDDGTPNYEQWGYGAHSLMIEDVPNDQGGWVNISFQKSYYDTDSLRNTESYSIEANYGNGWIVSASGNAYGEDQYIYQVHTQMDSSNTSDGLIDFRVIAGMDEGNFASEVIQGYSVDNIVPAEPGGLEVSSTSSNNITLDWIPNTDDDLAGYNVYRDNEEPIFSTLSEFIDNEPLNTHFTYTVKAVDINGNESEGSEKYMNRHNIGHGNNLLSLPGTLLDNGTQNLLDKLNNNNCSDANFLLGQGLGLFNTEDGWSGNLNNVLATSGYWLNVDGNCDFDNEFWTVDFESSLPECESYPISSGNNLVSFRWGKGSKPTLEALGGEEFATANFNFILGQGLGLFNTSDGWSGNLNELIEGKGYWVNTSNENLEFRWGFDDCANIEDISSLPKEDIVQQIPEEFQFIQSTDQAFYLIIEIEEIENGDMITAYCGDQLVGSAIWDGKYTAVPVMGRDMSEQTVGFCEPNEVPSLFWSKEQGEGTKELAVALNSTKGDIPGFTNLGVYTIDKLESVENVILPTKWSLAPAYPNPFNPKTTIEIGVPEMVETRRVVSLQIYDINGRLINTLIDGHLEPGFHTIEWDATGNPSGVYFVKLIAGDPSMNSGQGFTQSQKLMLVK